MHNRGPAGGRLNNARVVVSASTDFNDGGNDCATLSMSRKQDLPCVASGQFVTIVLPGWLHFCELEVNVATFKVANGTECSGISDGTSYSAITERTEECTMAAETLGLEAASQLPCRDSQSGDPICSIPQADNCVRGATRSFAEEVCAAEGARLCTEQEIEADCVNGDGCDGTSSFIWTSTPW